MWKRCPLLAQYKKKRDPRVGNIMLMCRGDVESVCASDRVMYEHCHEIINDVIRMYGNNYWQDKKYLLHFKKFNN